MLYNLKKTYVTQAREGYLHELVTHLSLPIKDMSLLNIAMTHTSYANEHRAQNLQHNQRLEFLGDAVLDLIIGEYLFAEFPQMTEGELTKIKAASVCEETLAIVGKQWCLGKYLLLGHGERTSGGAQRPSILADTVESIIGALYLDRGFTITKEFVLSHLAGYIRQSIKGTRVKDYKTQLQEFVQREEGHRIQYFLEHAEGPDHAKQFHMAVAIDGKRYGRGVGKSKKMAEQEAARVALEKLMTGKRSG